MDHLRRLGSAVIDPLVDVILAHPWFLGLVAFFLIVLCALTIYTGCLLYQAFIGFGDPD